MRVFEAVPESDSRGEPAATVRWWVVDTRRGPAGRVGGKDLYPPVAGPFDHVGAAARTASILGLAARAEAALGLLAGAP